VIDVPSGQTVGAVSLVQRVISRGHLVGSSGQSVTVPGQAVITVRALAHSVGSAGHFVSSFGHRVGSCGQMVTTPMPSGHTVAAPVVLGMHRVGSCGHDVCTTGQNVWPVGHSVIAGPMVGWITSAWAPTISATTANRLHITFAIAWPPLGKPSLLRDTKTLAAPENAWVYLHGYDL